MNINHLAKILNTNKDNMIQLDEILDFRTNSKAGINSVFNNYLDTIKEDILISDFVDNFKVMKIFSKDDYFVEPDGYPVKIETEAPKSYEEISDGWLPGQKCALGQDISHLDLTPEQLMNLEVDSTTTMNDEQQEIMAKYIEKMKNPGLNEDELHSQGITGKNVKIAVIDSVLSYNDEIEENIIHYDNCMSRLHSSGSNSYHMNAVASIAAGKTCGVAPDAKLLCYSAAFCDEHIVAIEKIIQQNKILKENNQPPISIISISCGFDCLPDYKKNGAKLSKIIQLAKDEGIAVITCEDKSAYRIYPVNANPSGDINSSQDYRIWDAFKDDDEYYKDEEILDQTLLIPGQHRTTAGMHNDYRYDGSVGGGQSWTIPYLAGVFAQAKQVRPDITFDEFYKIALETADKCYNYDDKRYIGKLINPVKIIQAIKL